MCLIVFAWNAHPDYQLILAANRDEFHRRPTQDAHWWADLPQILAGRDLQAGGLRIMADHIIQNAPTETDTQRWIH